MPKKLALFVLGLMLAFGAFLLYQYASGQHTGDPVVVKPPPATAPIQILPATFEERDDQGRLVYLIRAAKSPEPILDANKNPIPGQYFMTQPEATFYRVGGRIIRINADSCEIVFDQSPRLGAGNSGKLKDQINLRTGQLEGHVRIYISGQQTPAPATTGAAVPATAPSKDPFPNGVRLYVDGPVVYDRTQGQLLATDGVHIRSDTASFDGSGLTLAVNQQAQRIDFLRIEKGKEILLRHIGDRFLPTTASTAPAPAAAPAPVVPAKPAKPQTVYRLVLSEDVHAKAGERSLDAESLNVLFATSEELSGIKAATNPAAAATGAGPGDEPVIPDMPLEPEAIAPADGNDLHITWSGPLELRPVENLNVKLGDGDVLLEAFGTAQKPVSIADGDRSAKAGHLWYHHDEQRVELEPGDFAHVLLGDAKGTVDCPSASILLDEKPTAVFNGPGTLVMRNKVNPDKLDASVTWKTHLHVDLQKVADEKDATKTTFVPRHATLDGVTIKSPEFDLAADVLDALIDMKSTQPLQHLLATGHVAVTSLHKEDGTEQGGLRTDAMEIVTKAGPTGPVPSQLLATGNVSGWRLIDRTKETDALGAQSRPAANAGPGPLVPAIEKDAITAGKLIADLQPRAKSDTQPAGKSADALSPMADFDPVHFLAQDDVRIEITPPAGSKRPPIVAQAAKLDAMPMKGTATLVAADGKTTPVRVAMGDNTIETRLIELVNQENVKTFTAPGAGVFNFMRPADDKNKKPTPMQVSWEKSMSYDDNQHLAVFTGSPIARTPGEQSNLGWLRSDDSLTVKLTRGANDPTPVDTAKLPVEWIEAVGNVHASGAQLDEKGGKPIDLQFSALDAPNKRGVLHYDAADQSFHIPGPGALVVNINQPAKPGQQADDASSNGKHGFGWKDRLDFDGKSNVITFKGDVDYVFQPANGFKFMRNTSKETEPDRAHLHTNLLTATFAKPDSSKSVKSPIGLQAGDILSVQASDGANMEVGGFRIDGGSLSFEPAKHTALILPGPDPGDRVVVERIGTEQRGTGRRVVMDMSNNQKSFQVDSPQGNLAGFTGPN